MPLAAGTARPCFLQDGGARHLPDLDLTGFDADALADLLAGGETTTEGQTDEDATPEVSETPVSRPGDVWICGEHRVLCGDATDPDAYAKVLGDGLAKGEKRVSFGDKTVEYRSIDELKVAIAEVEKAMRNDAVATGLYPRAPRQIRVITGKGF